VPRLASLYHPKNTSSAEENSDHRTKIKDAIACIGSAMRSNMSTPPAPSKLSKLVPGCGIAFIVVVAAALIAVVVVAAYLVIRLVAESSTLTPTMAAGGNVWRWCKDSDDSAEDSSVLRGGSWDDTVDIGYQQLLSSYRGHVSIIGRFAGILPVGELGGAADNIGFRCVVAKEGLP
jgi:hypothetical protein